MTALLVLVAALYVAAAGSAVSGVFLLAGLPSALICGSAFALAAAFILRKGISLG